MLRLKTASVSAIFSRSQLRATVGLRGRRLLRAPDGSYTALVEHDSASSFAAMRKAEAISMIHHGLGQILSDSRQAMRYDVLVDFPTAETCCCDGHETCGCEGAEQDPGLRLVRGGVVHGEVSCAGDGKGRP